jgi:hypothetical protein
MVTYKCNYCCGIPCTLTLKQHPNQEPKYCPYDKEIKEADWELIKTNEKGKIK